jgi:hypothetical protein
VRVDSSLLRCSDGLVDFFPPTLPHVGFHFGARAVAQRVKSVSKSLTPVSGMLVFTWDNLKGSSDHRPFPPLAKFHVSKVPAVKMKADRLSIQAIDDRVTRGAERAQHVEIQLAQLVRLAGSEARCPTLEVKSCLGSEAFLGQVVTYQTTLNRKCKRLVGWAALDFYFRLARLKQSHW